MSASIVRAKMLAKEGNKEAIELADYFCREARVRIEQSFRELYGPNDAAMRNIAKHVLDGKHTWMERGIVGLMSGMPGAKPAPGQDGTAPRATREAAGV
jgi:hypothetical protein